MRMLMFVRFLLYTLNPLCKGLKRDEKRKKESEEVVIAAVNNETKYKLSAKRCKEIECKLIKLEPKWFHR